MGVYDERPWLHLYGEGQPHDITPEYPDALTMFAALLFLTGGVFRLAGSVVVRGPQMGWTLV